jgi:hypothetical protein
LSGTVRLLPPDDAMKKHLATLTFVAIVMFAAAQVCLAKDWRGLTPLRSTREDVVRLLNQCGDQKEACTFTLADEDVYILFSSGLNHKYIECAERFPPEMIMLIDVELQKPHRFKDLGLNKAEFQKFNPMEPDAELMGFKGYWRQIDGLLVTELKGKVIELAYVGTANDRALCSSFYSDPKRFVKVVWVHVPTVTVTCPRQPSRAGELIQFSAWTDINARRGFKWAVSAGRIVSGQNTERITVDTAGLAVTSIEALAEVRDVFMHAAISSCKVQIKDD